jgi:peptidyl-prolyl cis-trans isomerase C
VAKKSLPSMFFLFLLMVSVLVSATARAADQDRSLAKIGNEVITEQGLKDLLDALPERFRQLCVTPEGKQKTVEYIVNIYVLADEAKRQGMEKNPEIARLLQFTSKDILARTYLEQITKTLPTPTEAEARAYYEKNLNEYTTPESVHLHHILVKTEKEAKDVMDRLKKGEKFADLASQVSICPSRSKGGNLDWIPKPALVKEIQDVAFTMPVGKSTGPIQSKHGYHVLLLEEKRPPVQNSFDQVKNYIIDQLKMKKQQEQYEKIAADLRKKANVEIAPPSPTPLPNIGE